MDMQHECAEFKCSIGIQQGHAAWRHGHAALT
jgi:hypothetical protein